MAQGRLEDGARADGAFISLRDSAATPTLRETLGGVVTDELLDETLERRIGELATELHAGRFEVKPHDCRHCSFRTVCRVITLASEDA